MIPWIIVALAVVMLGFIVAKCISIYRKLKRSKTYVKREGEVVQTLAVRGEFFIMVCGVAYSVGEDGQLRSGKYVLRGDGYDEFCVKVNDEERQCNVDEMVELNDGDTIVAVTCDTLIKPFVE